MPVVTGVLARAKINLFLRVFPPGADGFHPLLSLFCSVTVADEISLANELSLPPLSVSYADDFLAAHPVPLGEDNIVLAAERAFREALALKGTVVDGAAWTLHKAIPSASGLGGGSADGAALLQLLNLSHETPFTADELATIARKVGADLPFCLRGGLAIGAGHGDELEYLAPLPALGIVIVRPRSAMNTVAAYAALDDYYGWQRGMPLPSNAIVAARARVSALVERLENRDLVAAAPLIDNDFQAPVMKEIPEIASIIRTFERLQVPCAFLTGSGSAVVAVVEDEGRAANLAATMAELPEAAWTKSCAIASAGVELVETR